MLEEASKINEHVITSKAVKNHCYNKQVPLSEETNALIKPWTKEGLSKRDDDLPPPPHTILAQMLKNVIAKLHSKKLLMNQPCLVLNEAATLPQFDAS